MFDMLVFFIAFSFLTLFSALMILFTENVIHCAFWLLLSFLGIAGAYVLVGADFLAVSQIVVYIGGVLILLLFGVMLTNNLENSNPQESIFFKNGVFSYKLFFTTLIKKTFFSLLKLENVLSFGLLYWLSTKILEEEKWKIVPQNNTQTTVYDIGTRLLTDHVLAFELVGILLLGVLVGILVFTKIEIKEGNVSL